MTAAALPPIRLSAYPGVAVVRRPLAPPNVDPRSGSGPAVATAPVNWNNSDVPAWAAEVPWAALLDAMVAAGYDATEFGANFPNDPDALGAALTGRGLRLCGAYQAFPLQDDGVLERHGPELDHLLRLLHAVGCRDLIVAFALTPERIELAGRVPSDGAAGMSEAQWSATARNLTDLGAFAADRGFRGHFHNHVGSFVETPAEIERLLEVLEPEVMDLCYDCGHHAFGGGDPTTFVQRHHDRIGYLHLKDVDPAVLARAQERRLGFLGALREFVFCELGQGLVDVPTVIGTLVDHGYRGWIVVEQDTTSRDSTDTARANRAFLRDRCGL